MFTTVKSKTKTAKNSKATNGWLELRKV